LAVDLLSAASVEGCSRV